MKPREHNAIFGRNYRSLMKASATTSLNIRAKGCRFAYIELAGYADQLGVLDAQYATVPDDHPVKKQMHARMKAAVGELKKAQATFARECVRRPSRGKAKRR